MSMLTTERRQLRQAMAAASDSALSRIMDMLDEAGNPLAAHTLIHDVRGRLRRIRPRRRIRLVRLLFLPLDGSIVDAQLWQRGSSQVPRSVLGILGLQLQQAAPAEWDALAQAAQGRHMDDPDVVGRLGRSLWALAARAMPEQPPPGWQAETGLKLEHHLPLVQLCVGVWREAGPLWDAVEHVAELPAPALQRALAPTLSDEKLFAACLATLMRHSPTPWLVAAEAGAMGAMPRLIAERALDAFLETAAPDIDAAAPGLSAQGTEHFADVCEALAKSLPAGRPERRRRLEQLRQETDRSCRAAYAAALEAQLMRPLAERTSAASAAEVMAMEERARQIRRLALAGRRIGGGAAYDKLEGEIAKALSDMLAGGTLTDPQRVDIARLTEIVCGSDAAGKLLWASQSMTR